MRKTCSVGMLVLLAVVMMSSWMAWGEEAEKPAFRWGADERIREEYFDSLPIKADPPGETRGGENNYFRFRTRVWGEYDPFENVTLKVRAVNEFREWDRRATMVPDECGIASAAGAVVVPDVVLVPCVGFAAGGYRLGYGGGYFDRTLASLRPRPIAIGVGFELARVDSIDPEEHDEPLAAIVTEAGVLRV